MRKAARVDENQPDIVAGLRYLGASVQCLHAVGGGCPDLLVGWRGVNYLLEVKNPEKPPSGRRLTKDQEGWHIVWEGQKAVIQSLDDAIRVVNCNGCGVNG